MAGNKENISSGKKGMNRDAHPSQLNAENYTFMMNGNIEGTEGNFMQLQNESSNFLCSTFKEGYQVIGHKTDLKGDRVFFFLTNPTTGLSEIGQIKNITCIDDITAMQVTCGCNISIILNTPLEDQEQVPTCSYETIIEDCEDNKCLNFDICHPIKEGSVQIKQEKCGDTLYFTDNYNPPRYLQLDNLEIYGYEGFINDCESEIETCLDCNKLRIFPLYETPCIEVNTIKSGGSLKAGTYQLLIAYSDAQGNERTPYFSLTNVIPLFDLSNNILDQTSLDYKTNLGIRAYVKDLDRSFAYYKIAIIQREGLEGALSYRVEGVHPIDDNTIVISSTEDKIATTLEKLLAKRSTFETAKGLAVGNGIMFPYGLKTKAEINLQPVVNLMGTFAKWATVMGKETLYKDGESVANYKTYMRDEVYPFSIKFFTDKGYETALFPFIARPPKPSDLIAIPEGTLNSLERCTSACASTPRELRWQAFNTATVEGSCSNSEDTSTSYEVTEERQCSPIGEGGTLMVVDSLTAGSFYIGINDVFTNTKDFLTINYTTVIDPSSSLTLMNTTTDYPAIREIMEDSDDDYSEYTCNPFTEECDEPAEVDAKRQILPLKVEGESITPMSQSLDKYSIVTPPETCNRLELTTGATPEPIEDTQFVNDYLTPSDTVYKVNTPSNLSCSSSTNIPFMLSTTVIDNPVYLQYSGGLTIGDVTIAGYTGLQDQGTPTGQQWFSDLHKGARWYNTTFAGRDQILLQLSKKGTCDSPDSISTGETVRVSAFNNCSSTNAIYSEIIDVVAGDIITLNRSNYSSDDIIVTIEPETRIDSEFSIELNTPSLTIGLTGTSGTANIVINATNYLLTFNTDLTVTADDFLTAHAATILSVHGITVYATTDTLYFEGADPLLSIGINNLTGNLNGVVTLGKVEIEIDGDSFQVEYNADLTTTALDFVANNSTALNLIGITVSSLGSTLIFRGFKYQYDSTFINTLEASLSGTLTLDRNIYLTTPPCNCFNLVARDVVIDKYMVSYDSITFYKLSTYVSTCEYSIPDYNGCNPSANQYGSFSYWESEEKYPCNDSLYDSSALKIDPNLIPSAILAEFVVNYAQYTMAGSTVVPTLDIDGYLVMEPTSNFTNKPIRHFKFPCSAIVPFMSTSIIGTGQETFIYPIGFDLSNEVINAFLDVAVTNNLLTQEDRDSIIKYEIYRGDRRTQRSIVAKGLVFDLLNYQEEGQTIHYPNFPYNDLGKDEINDVPHPYAGKGNTKFTFHSPDTHFSKPVLGTEMKVEGYQFGQSEGKFTVVEEHPTWVILGDRAYSLASTLAVAEVVFEGLVIAGQSLVNAAAGGISAPAAIIIAASFTVAVTTGILFKVGGIRYQWLETFKNLGQPENFAYFYSSVGMYNVFKPNTDENNMIRGLCSTSYLTEGRLSVTDELTTGVTRINNTDRESSVYLSVGNTNIINYPANYYTHDNKDLNGTRSSRIVANDIGCGTEVVTRSIASPYISIKDYVPDQYGEINSVKWLGTGTCRNLNEENGCHPVFGGDTFISRFSWKRKMPLFLTDAMGVAPLTPFKYSQYKNIPSLKFYVDYDLDEGDKSVGSYLYPEASTDVSNMDCVFYTNKFYIKQPAKFYLYYYGIPYFLVESDINTWVRYAKREQHERFYPQVTDYVNWTQERNVSIREPNTFFYNGVYSTEGLTLSSRLLSNTFDAEKEECASYYPNGIIYSEPDNNEDNSFDPWLVYKPFNFTELPASYGRLIDLHFIESNQLLGRFENQVLLFNRLNDYLDGTTVSNIETGTGSLFKARPIEYNSTELGYTGTQHSAMVSCEFGHYWVDAKRGQVFEMAPGGKGLNEITQGVRGWFKEHLPFKILKSNITDLTTEDIDNNCNGLGITMTWDARHRRVFITKRDYKLKLTCSNDVYFRDCKFYIIEEEEEIEIKLTDTEYFEDCSFTIAYSPLVKAWISYYSFKPDYYVSHLNYFQSGVNITGDSSEKGLWSHLLSNNSYQVFYGKKYPWTIELPLNEQLINSMVHNVQYWLDVRAYTNKYDYADRSDLGFNEAVVYNNSATSGKLKLVTEIPNNLKQKMEYPKFQTDSVEILTTSKYKKWSFNYLYDLSINKNSNVPIWNNDINQINKTINPSAIKYINTWKNRLQGDWFLVRLEQNKESRLNFIFKWQQDKRNYFDA